MPRAKKEAWEKVLDRLNQQHAQGGYTVFEVGFLRKADGSFDVRFYEAGAANPETPANWDGVADVIHIPKED